MHFFEDYLGTLERVAEDVRLEGVRLYLADWGYNTESMRTRAAAQARIEVIGFDGLAAVIDPVIAAVGQKVG